MTIPISTAEEAGELAALYASQGFQSIKTKVGLDPAGDIDRLAAIHAAHPRAELLMDANEGFPTAEAAVEFLRALARHRIPVSLLVASNAGSVRSVTCMCSSRSSHSQATRFWAAR